MAWTDERVERLKVLWKDGHSCSIIAGLLGGGATRNSIIGKVSRLGLPGRKTIARLKGTHTRGKNQPHPWHKPKKAGKPFRFQTSPNMVRQVAFTPEPLPMPAADDLARVSARAVEDSHCRWPVGDPTDLATRMDDPFHCGLPKMPGSSYCAGHHARATVPLTPRQQRHSNVVPMPKKELQVA